MKFKPVILIALIAVLTACSTFIPDEEYDRLKLINQSGEYILLDKVERHGIVLEKGSVVNLIILSSDEWIKVYAYKSEEGLLVANRLLILYMFESDFPEKKFDRVLFNKELEKIVKPKTFSAQEKDVKKPRKKFKKKKG